MVVKIQAQKENVIDLIKTGNSENLEITKLDQSMVNFNENTNDDTINTEDDNNEDQPKEIISSVIPHISKNTPFSILMNYNSAKLINLWKACLNSVK